LHRIDGLSQVDAIKAAVDRVGRLLKGRVRSGVVNVVERDRG